MVYLCAENVQITSKKFKTLLSPAIIQLSQLYPLSKVRNRYLAINQNFSNITPRYSVAEVRQFPQIFSFTVVLFRVAGRFLNARVDH